MQCRWNVAAHGHPISHVRCVDAECMFLTASQDHNVKAWSWEETDNVPSLLAVLERHSDAVCSVDVHPDGQRCCSVGWDAQILVWPCGTALREAEEESATGAKRQKTEIAARSSAKRFSPLGTLEGHVGCVSDVLWPSDRRLFTSGWDHTLRRWDVASGTTSEMLTAHRVIQCITCPLSGAPLVAFGSTDAVLRLWDTRVASESLSLKLYRSHKGGIVSVAWSPISDVHIASASHDGTVRIWDMRGTVPVASCGFHSDKCLAVDWCRDWTIASGGADSMLYIADVNPSLT